MLTPRLWRPLSGCGPATCSPPIVGTSARYGRSMPSRSRCCRSARLVLGRPFLYIGRSGLCKGQRDAVDAVTQPRRLRAVAEQIAEVRVAAATGHFTLAIPGARLTVHDVLLGDRLPIARPARA